MTRQQSRELLADIRRGATIELETNYGTTQEVYLYESWRDYKDYVAFDGYGSSSCKNTYEDFYNHVRDCSLKS